jgi:hypothetical protein
VVPSPARVAPTANARAPVASAGMAWLWWLAAPVAATTLAAVWAWFRGRPEPLPTTDEAMRAHRDYLDGLAAAVAESARRTGPGEH